VLKEVEREVFVRACCGDSEDGVPASFAHKARARALRSEHIVEGDEIGMRMSDELCPELSTGLKECRKRVLNGCIHREIGIGDDFQAPAGVLLEIFWTG